jgi:2-dehydropantoate 2-reductase
MARDTAVVTFQNGLENLETVAAVVGVDAVLAGAVYVALQLVAPGVILSTGGEGRIVFGELHGAVTERVRRIAGTLQRSGTPHDVSTDIERALWEKFLFIAGVGGVTALAGSGIGALLASPAGRTLLTAACAEIVGVAEATGAPLPKDAVNAVIEQAATLPPQWRSSMARDLDDGRRLEVDALSGAVVRRGLKHGVPTPVHQTIAACLSVHQPMASDRVPAPMPSVVHA